MEARLPPRLREAGTRMLGPNSAGVFSAGGKVNCLGWKVPDGNIALITQSGNMAGTFTQYARNKGVGFASILAVGNSADLRLSELVELQLADAWTKAILIYCEGFAPGDGRRLVEVASASNGRIPIIVLKPGASEAGRIARHTPARLPERTPWFPRRLKPRDLPRRRDRRSVGSSP